ncbi:hypothetical protein FOA52_003661 [Chlamydomonas sp. UWO 241]|nr:hypothetical protein FOA52_003661 [Chlamydomonas sp. UWO 241]
MMGGGGGPGSLGRWSPSGTGLVRGAADGAVGVAGAGCGTSAAAGGGQQQAAVVADPRRLEDSARATPAAVAGEHAHALMVDILDPEVPLTQVRVYTRNPEPCCVARVMCDV